MYTRKDIIKFYFTSECTELCFCCKSKQKKKKRKKKRLPSMDRSFIKETTSLSEVQKTAKEHWRILHRGCYGHILVEADGKKKENQQMSMHSTRSLHGNSGPVSNAANLRAITMSQLMAHFENYGAKFDVQDSALLKQLTSTETLFCEFCNRPILSSPEHLIDALTTPYAALIDLLSAFVFVSIPIAWLALIVVLGVFCLFDGIGHCFEKNDDRSKYQSEDFDREFFPNQFTKNQKWINEKQSENTNQNHKWI